jgi:tight adherence protein C
MANIFFSPTYIAYAIAAVGIFTLYMAVMHVFRKGGFTQKVKSAAESGMLQEDAEEQSAFAEFAAEALKFFKIDVLSQRELALTLTRAGFTSEHASTYYLFARYAIQPLFLLIAIYLTYKAFFVPEPSISHMLSYLLASGIFVLGGLRGAQIFVENSKTKRAQTLSESFPEMLDLMLVCIESGLGLDAALNRVCKELRSMYPAMVSELDRTRLELTMLGDRVVALQNLADRTEITPFRTLVSALIQSEKFGTSLVDTLRVLADDLRTTRLYTAEQKAARIPVLITLPLIICILPAFIMIIVAPPLVKVMSQGGIFGSSIAGR